MILELNPLPNKDLVEEELLEDEKRLNWFNKYYNHFLNFDARIWKEVYFEDGEKKAPSLGVKSFPHTDYAKKEMEKLVETYSPIDEKKENIFFSQIEQIKAILQEIKRKYDKKLLELNKIDYDTIISMALEMIPKVNTDFKYIMVDEFQDTNETQFEIVHNSMNCNTNLFVVGDSKQSIYSFQGAEIEVFHNTVENTELFSSVEDMSTNFRSDGVLLNTVNSIFQKLMKSDIEKVNSTLTKHNFEAKPQDLNVSKEDKEKIRKF